jgi:tetratricopeptide (TPR) repeat protein
MESTEDRVMARVRQHALSRGALCAAGILFASAAAGEHDSGHGTAAVAKGEEIGAVDFRVSCHDAVRERFDHAVGLMHHMMYVQARSEFEAVAEADPECAMAHWGIASTLFQPLWPERPGRQELERGWKHIRKAQELEPPTDREALLVEATARFFRDPEAGGYWSRIEGWAAGMAEAAEAHRDDLDVAALYGLSRLALAQRAHDRDPLYDEAEAVLRAVWEKEPTHPGAIHYSIHATDVDGRARNALDMVEVYGEIAPRVPHALHMPSHIYVRLGEWPEVISWNRASADAARDHDVNGAVSHHFIHALDYLLYAHLQRGDDARAKAAFEEATAVGRHQPSFISAFHAAAMPARLAVERRRWEDTMALAPRTPDDLPWETTYWPEGLVWYARGLGGVHGGDLDAAREAEQRLRALRDAARADDEDAFATYIEVDRKILSGWIARHEGETEEAVRLMRAAAALEGTVEKHPVTPGALLPPYEALGDLLLDLEQPSDALEAYRRADAIWPGRFHTLLGAARAARADDDEETAAAYYGRLLAIAGDSEREAIREARSYLGR